MNTENGSGQINSARKRALSCFKVASTLGFSSLPLRIGIEITYCRCCTLEHARVDLYGFAALPFAYVVVVQSPVPVPLIYEFSWLRVEDFRGGGSIPPPSDGLFAQRNTVGNIF